VSATVTPRRFPPPWSIEDIGAAFVVKDSSGQKLAYVNYEQEQPQWPMCPRYSAAEGLGNRDPSRRCCQKRERLEQKIAGRLDALRQAPPKD
jgi:hypothetical protein